MKSLFGVVTLSVGIILIYAAIKNKDPRDVVKEALGAGKAAATGQKPVTGSVNITGTPQQNPGNPNTFGNQLKQGK